VSATSDLCELVLVDDGSIDDSWAQIQALASEDASIRGVRLSRNYGKEAAIFAGLSRARGEHVLVMDADLQHPPEAIAPMLEAYRAQGVDVMNGVKRRRADEPALYRSLARAFNAIFTRLSGMDLENASDFKILSRPVVDSMLELHERGVFFRGLTHWVGFTHGTYEFDVADRAHGASSWSMADLFRFALNALTSYSSSMLQVVSLMGLVFTGFALVLGVQTLINKLSGQAVDGFTTVILLLLIIGAVIMLSLGIIGQYIASIYEEVKGRPRFIVRDET
jgi:glycosyltransferase involved in cell wall biosynthesis